MLIILNLNKMVMLLLINEWMFVEEFFLEYVIFIIGYKLLMDNIVKWLIYNMGSVLRIRSVDLEK